MITREKRNNLIGIHVREAYRLILGGYPEDRREEAEDMAREAAIDFMVQHGLTSPEIVDKFGVSVGDFVQTFFMMALLRHPDLEQVMSSNPA